MKYLVFNAVVFLALGYLVAGGEPQDIKSNVQKSVQNITAKAEQMLEPEQAQKPKRTTYPVADPKPEPKVQQVVETKPVVEPVEEVKKPIAPPPIPEPVAVAKLEPKQAPSRTLPAATQTVAPVAPVAVAQIQPQTQTETSNTAQVQLSDARERSKALRQMVADMEAMFAEKMAR